MKSPVVAASADAVARRILRDLFPRPTEPEAEGRRTFPLAEFQEEGLVRARQILGRRGGVVIADEVGLGKSFLALALMEEALQRGAHVGVIAPAALRPMWEQYVKQLAGVKAGPDCTAGAGRDATGSAGRVLVTTHTRLGRGTHPRTALGRAELLVVDEAHAFRNPRTRRYSALADLGQTARLVLLTATPVNNHPSDLIHLVRTFAHDQGFSDVGVASLSGLVSRNGRGETAAGRWADVRRVAREVVVRRSRRAALAVREGASPPSKGRRTVRVGGTRLSFPRREPPELVRYDDPCLADAVALIESLELAPYGAHGATGVPRGPAGADALLRLGLVKRLDSSRAAFVGSVRRLQSLLYRFEEAARAGRLVRPADQRADALAALSDEDAVQLVMDALVLEQAPAGLDLAALAESARRDRRRLEEWVAGSGGADPKRDALVRFVRDGGGDKLLIFTEFRDTTRALWRALVPEGGVGRIDGEGAWLGSRRSSRGAVIRRFAPAANGASEPSQRERVRILVATDVLGEGQNLQDAGVVVSYDLPWNPVRLLQRIGRVDRLGSPHDRVRTVLFVPASGVDEMLGLTRRLRMKLDGIVRTVGAEQAESLLGLLAGGGVGASHVEGARPAADVAPSDDPWERLRSLLARETGPVREVIGHDDSGTSSDDQGPVLAGWLGAAELRHGAGGPDPNVRGWLILVRAGAHPWLVAVDPAGRPRLADQEAAHWLMMAMGEGGEGGDLTALAPVLDRAIQAARSFVEAELATAAAPPPLHRQAASSRLGAIVRRMGREACTRGDATLMGTADRLLEVLARPAAAAMEPRIMALLEWARSVAAQRLGPGEFLQRIADILDQGEGPERRAMPGVELRVVAVLAVGLEAVDGGGRRV